MMPLLSSFIQVISEILGRFKKPKLNENHPKNLVRLCRNRTEFITIINEAINSQHQNWDRELVRRVVDYILDDANSSISVYSSDTLDPLDRGHALAVIAEGISQDSFRSNKGSKRKKSCTRGSLMIATSCLPATTFYEFTPENNLDFYPANNYHFDLSVNNKEELAIIILNGINQRIITWSILGNEPKYAGSYRIQAAIAYSHCLQMFGKLNPDTPPSVWVDGKRVVASEQIDTLKYLAETVMLDSPILNE